MECHAEFNSTIQATPMCVCEQGWRYGGKRKNRIEIEVEDKSLLTACESLFGEEPLENHELA